jgi:hypothetical protein
VTEPRARSVPLSDQLAPVAALLGTFEGDGSGDYPTIEPFRYRERVTFRHTGKPFLAYEQRTWHPDTDAPMHAELGYLRVPGPTAEAVAGAGPVADGRGPGVPVAVEFVLVHPTGIVEVEEGTLVDGVLTLATTTVGRTATAKAVRSLRRTIRFEADRLAYDLWMAYADVPDTHHLHAELDRVD